MSDEQIKIAVCIPSGDSIKTSTALALAAMLQCNRMQLGSHPIAVKYTLINMRTANLAYSRNEMARAALARSADYVLFIDSDMTFPMHTACRLVEVARGVGSGLAGAVGASRIEGAVWRGEQTEGLQEAQTLGGGVLLVSSEVFRKVAEPWFLCEIAPGDQAPLGEDAYFTRKARAAGFTLAADYDLSKSVGHAGEFTYTLDEAADIGKMRSVHDARGNWAAPIRVIPL